MLAVAVTAVDTISSILYIKSHLFTTAVPAVVIVISIIFCSLSIGLVLLW